MLRLMSRLGFVCALASALLGGAMAAEDANLEKLQGKWEVKKTNDEGQKYSQIIEIKKDKLTFKIVGEDQTIRLYATGQVKAEKLGPFNVMKVTDIQAGPSESELEPVDDDRTNIYQVGYDTLTMASNFDKERNNPPVVDVYRKTS